MGHTVHLFKRSHIGTDIEFLVFDIMLLKELLEFGTPDSTG